MLHFYNFYIPLKRQKTSALFWQNVRINQRFSDVLRTFFIYKNERFIKMTENLIRKWKYLLVGRNTFYGGMKTSLVPLILFQGATMNVLKTEACITGSGVVSNDTSAKRFFISQESNCHINVLEKQSILVLKVYVEIYDLWETHTKVMIDNPTLVLSINNMGRFCLLHAKST